MNGGLFSSWVMFYKYILLIFPIIYSNFTRFSTTLFFSCATPNLPTVIPAMEHIDAHLTTASQNLRLSPALHALLALGKAHLNKYYALTDHTEVY